MRRDPAPMALTLGVGLCTVPVILFLLAPLVGLKTAALAAGSLLVALALLCWSVCAAGAEDP